MALLSITCFKQRLAIAMAACGKRAREFDLTSPVRVPVAFVSSMLTSVSSRASVAMKPPTSLCDSCQWCGRIVRAMTAAQCFWDRDRSIGVPISPRTGAIPRSKLLFRVNCDIFCSLMSIIVFTFLPLFLRSTNVDRDISLVINSELSQEPLSPAARFSPVVSGGATCSRVWTFRRTWKLWA